MDTVLVLASMALLTSGLAAVAGFGGGMLLIAVMPGFLPPAAVIPVHGVTQLASNGSRAWFGRRDIAWHLLPPFLLGSVLGVVVFAPLLAWLDSRLLPVAIGIYILCNTWWEGFARQLRRYESLPVLGVLQSGLGLLVGATGPLVMSALVKRLGDANRVIVTAALFMTVSHAAKLVVFGLLGFAFGDYLALIAGMVAGSSLGSWLGSGLRRRIPRERLLHLLRWLLTLLALKMLLESLLGLLF